MTSEQKKELTAERLDAMLHRRKRWIWGLGAIANRINRSEDTVRKLARHPEAPVWKPPGQNSYCSEEHELEAWMRTKQASD